jgi:arylsulfatase A-like enzyme
VAERRPHCPARSLALAWLAAAALACSAREAPDFDVVLVVVDTLRVDRLSFYGGANPSTPFLDELARRSAVFERAHSASTWTAPATASLFTSLYPSQHGLWTGYVAAIAIEKLGRINRIPQAAPTLPEVMRGLGFRTFGVADNLNISEEMGFARGFDRFARHEHEGAGVMNATVREWLPEIQAPGRSFLYLHYMEPHAPYPRHDEWLRPDSGTDQAARLSAWGRRFDASQLGDALESYDSALGFLDAHLRELYELLGWGENTLLILTADHGEEFLDHGHYGHHLPKLYAELLRVPLLVFFPGRFEPRRIRDNVSLIDLLPTLRELAGGEPSPLDEGRSLVPLLEGGDQPERTLFAMRVLEGVEPAPALTAAIRGRWKYVVTSPGGTEELFDLEADPADQRNRVDEAPGVAAELRETIAEFEASAARLPREYGAERTREHEEHLRALGYIQ